MIATKQVTPQNSENFRVAVFGWAILITVASSAFAQFACSTIWASLPLIQHQTSDGKVVDLAKIRNLDLYGTFMQWNQWGILLELVFSICIVWGLKNIRRIALLYACLPAITLHLSTVLFSLPMKGRAEGLGSLVSRHSETSGPGTKDLSVAVREYAIWDTSLSTVIVVGLVFAAYCISVIWATVENAKDN